MIKLVAVDLDGTLVHDHEIGEEDKEALFRALDQEIPIVPATTRLRPSTARFFEDISIDRYPLVCNNGARVLDSSWSAPSGCTELSNIKLNRDIAEEIATYADERDYNLSTVFPEKVYRKKELEGKSEDPMVIFKSKNIEALKNGTPVNFMIHKIENDLDALDDIENFVLKKFEDDVRIDRHHHGEEYRSLTIYDKSVSKLNGLELVCDRLGISLEDVLAIGDDEVDREMIERAGIGIAMGDAPAAVKEVAADVGLDCENNGVAWALNKYIF
ncbi:MAG: HAD family hydrolase [Candidatus Thermoplasmatota archaeon]|nr:HAD family hydrolase [Candidatus Thermoplasmatota archaeon]